MASVADTRRRRKTHFGLPGFASCLRPPLNDDRERLHPPTPASDAVIEKEMFCSLVAAKSDLILGLKHRDSSLCKLKLEQTEDEMADFRSFLDSITQILQNNSNENCPKEGSRQSDVKCSGSKRLDNEVKRLKSEYEKLVSEKDSEISALLKEKSFVWNQYNVLERSLGDKLNKKQSEVDQASAKIAKLLTSMEMLQSSNDEKVENIGRLKAKLAAAEVDRDKWKEENSRLSQELELLKKSKSAQLTPSLKHCNIGAQAANRVIKNNSRYGSSVVIKRESSAKATATMKDSEKGSRGSKRKEVEAATMSETPKLFSAAFKVPKLKIPSTPTT